MNSARVPTTSSDARRRRSGRWAAVGLGALALATVMPFLATAPGASATGPTLLDPNLGLRVVASGIARPVGIAFLPDGSALVLDKTTGRVLQVRDGVVERTVLDLAVNSNTPIGSERGLLGIALHPGFPADPGVYLYWTKSISDADTTATSDTEVNANRVDRFTWTGDSLVFDKNLITLRTQRNDAGVNRAGHHGGIIRFGPDGKLYVVTGDVGRRGWMQNLPCGPTTTCPGPTVADDVYGGPAPDDAHLTGVVLRLNDDGTTPSDNPFFAYGASVGGQVGANLQKVFAYGIRNSFGLAFDPVSGALWDQENSEDSFDEVNRVDPGFNSGWVQVMGPLSRYQDWRSIENTLIGGQGEVRYPTTNMAPTADEARARLFMLPGAQYSDPELSWKYGFPLGGLGFVRGDALGRQYRNDLLVGAAVGGSLLRLQLTGNRQKVAVDDPRLEDRVADNTAKFDLTESESLLFGTGFGSVVDVETGPNGNLYLVDLGSSSPTNPVAPAIYEVYRK